MLDPRLYPYPQPLGEQYSISTATTIPLIRAVTEINFTADAAHVVTLKGPVLPGMLVTMRRTNVGTSHDVKLKLPDGYTFDGTNTHATPAKAKDNHVTAICINSNRFAIIGSAGAITLSTS